MAESKEKLFDQFPPVSTQEWKEKVVADLKGADFDKKLVWRTNEGFNVNPMYRAEDIANLSTTDSLPGEYPYVRGTRADNNWLVRQDIKVTDVKEANVKALDILKKGVESLGFEIAKDLISVENLKTLLHGIDVENVELNFSTCMKSTVKLAETVAAYFKTTSIDLTKVSGSIRFNPFKRMLTKGRDFANYADQAVAVIDAVKELPGFRVLAVDAVMLNNAGSFISQELGFALAWGNEWLAALTDKGLSVDEVAKRVKFNFGISSNYFMELAKFRAARMLWAQIVKQYNPACDCACKMKAHAQTSEFNQTIFDAHVNLLRSQTETMSAALAGVDSITTTPFDKAYKEPDDFSERIARNQQLLLKEESHFDKIVDPAGGSYYIEELTQFIAEAAWKLFLEVQEQGGMVKALESGFVQAAVKATAQKRDQDIANRKENFLGTNQFPNFNEKMDKELCACILEPEDKTAPDAVVETLKPYRGTQAFEAMRIRTDLFAKEQGRRPVVYMFPMGNLAMRKARAQFACNFFACAGFQVMDNNGFKTVEEGAKACMDNKADIVVICSSDDEYATIAPEVYAAMKDKAIIVVAGNPECRPQLEEIGIKNYVHVKCNVLEDLKAYQQKLGIK